MVNEMSPFSSLLDCFSFRHTKGLHGLIRILYIGPIPKDCNIYKDDCRPFLQLYDDYRRPVSSAATALRSTFPALVIGKSSTHAIADGTACLGRCALIAF